MQMYVDEPPNKKHNPSAATSLLANKLCQTICRKAHNENTQASSFCQDSDFEGSTSRTRPSAHRTASDRAGRVGRGRIPPPREGRSPNSEPRRPALPIARGSPTARVGRAGLPAAWASGRVASPFLRRRAPTETSRMWTVSTARMLRSTPQAYAECAHDMIRIR